MFFLHTSGAELCATTEKVDSSLDGNYIWDPTYTDALAAIGGVVYFVSYKSATGVELFKFSDTSSAGSGSASLISVRSGSASASPTYLTVMGSSLYFAANDGSNGVELWSYNGTSASMVANINGGGSSNPYSLMAVGSTLFFVADDGSHGYELWKVSGTSASMVGDLYAGSSSSNPGGSYGTAMATDGTSLYFRATTLNGYELFQTDGTTTSLVKTIGADGYLPENFALAAGDLYFSADVGGHGNELWKLTLNADRTDLFYTAAWQVIEEREDGSTDASNQYVWSPVYVDALILRDRDADSDIGSGDLGATDSGLEERIYIQHDLTFNTSSILVWDEGEDEWVVGERYLYDPYGEVTITDAEYELTVGNESDFDLNYLFQGKRYGRTVFIYDSRERPYSATVGWLGQDPLGYPDGLSRYALLKNNPVRFADPYGLKTIADYTLGKPARSDALMGGKINVYPSAMLTKELNAQGASADKHIVIQYENKGKGCNKFHWVQIATMGAVEADKTTLRVNHVFVYQDPTDPKKFRSFNAFETFVDTGSRDLAYYDVAGASEVTNDQSTIMDAPRIVRESTGYADARGIEKKMYAWFHANVYLVDESGQTHWRVEYKYNHKWDGEFEVIRSEPSTGPVISGERIFAWREIARGSTKESNVFVANPFARPTATQPATSQPVTLPHTIPATTRAGSRP